MNLKFFKTIPLCLALLTVAVSALPVPNERSLSVAARGELEDIAKLSILSSLESRSIIAARSDADDIEEALNELVSRDLDARSFLTTVGKVWNGIKNLGRKIVGKPTIPTVTPYRPPRSLVQRDLELEARVSDEIFNAARSLVARDLEDDEIEALREIADAGSALMTRDLDARSFLTTVGKVWNGIKNLGRKIVGKPTIPTVTPYRPPRSLAQRDLELEARVSDEIFNAARSLVARDLEDDEVEALKEIADAGSALMTRDLDARSFLTSIGKIWNGVKNLGRKIVGKPTIPTVTPYRPPRSLVQRDSELEARVSDEIFNAARSLLARDLESDEIEALKEIADAGSALMARDLDARSFLTSVGKVWNGIKNLGRKLVGKPTIPTVTPYRPPQ